MDDPPPLNADQYRARARNCFRRAVAEQDPVVREDHLREGERWMARWRMWAPDPVRADAETDEPARSSSRSSGRS
jgi:hypothetical protein